jgi:hypothetical protein
MTKVEQEELGHRLTELRALVATLKKSSKKSNKQELRPAEAELAQAEKTADLETSLEMVTVKGSEITISLENVVKETTCYVRPLLENEDFEFQKVEIKGTGGVAKGEQTFTRKYEWKDKGPRWIFVEIALKPRAKDCEEIKTHVDVLHWQDPQKATPKPDPKDSWSTKQTY